MATDRTTTVVRSWLTSSAALFLALFIVSAARPARAEEYMLMVPTKHDIRFSRSDFEPSTNAPVVRWTQLAVFANGVQCDARRWALLENAQAEFQAASEQFNERANLVPKRLGDLPPSEWNDAKWESYWSRELMPRAKAMVDKKVQLSQLYLGKCLPGSQFGLRDRE